MKFSWAHWKEQMPPSVSHPLLCFLAAFRFLTIIPLHWRSEHDGDYFQHSLHYFPVIGALIGLFVGSVAIGIRSFFPVSVVTVIIMALLAVVSGCLHLDGLADTADGFFSSRPKERILEIMRDSRIGAMGVIGIVLILLAKYAALSSLPRLAFFRTVCLMPLAGRCAIVLTMALLRYARNEEGLGKLFYSKYCRLQALWALFFLLALMPFAGIKVMLLVIFTTIGVAGVFSLWCWNKIGGATGDTLGAVCEITEAMIAVVLANTLITY